jgi:hypothetical protein
MTSGQDMSEFLDTLVLVVLRRPRGSGDLPVAGLLANPDMPLILFSKLFDQKQQTFNGGGDTRNIRNTRKTHNTRNTRNLPRAHTSRGLKTEV